MNTYCKGKVERIPKSSGYENEEVHLYLTLMRFVHREDQYVEGTGGK